MKPSMDSITYRELAAMPKRVRSRFLATFSDEDYRLLASMIAYHVRRDPSFLDNRTLSGLIVEGRIRLANAHEQHLESVDDDALNGLVDTARG